MAKDIGIAEQLQVPTPLGCACAEIWRDGAASSGKTTDHTEMYRITN